MISLLAISVCPQGYLEAVRLAVVGEHARGQVRTRSVCDAVRQLGRAAARL